MEAVEAGRIKKECLRLAPQASGLSERYYCSLERELPAELNRARIPNGGYLAIHRGCDVGLNGSEVGVVENVEKFTTQLQFHPAFIHQIDVLKKREIEARCRWSIDGTAAGVRNDVRNRRRRRVQLETLSPKPKFKGGWRTG